MAALLGDIVVITGVIFFFVAPMVLIPFQLTVDWARERERKRMAAEQSQGDHRGSTNRRKEGENG